MQTVRIADNLQEPVFADAPPGDITRIVVLEQLTGRVRLIKNSQLQTTPFLDIGHKVNGGVAGEGSKGLLGLAFHPNYASNGFVYVCYSDQADDKLIERYKANIHGDSANANTAALILKFNSVEKHYGGMIAFSPIDQYLYIANGDFTGAGDPLNNSQRGDTLAGKILRIDVDGGFPYVIPADNPFVGNSNFQDEIWSLGWRHPWRFSFDAKLGDMYVGDVGQDDWEEISFQSGSSAGGENYGWRLKEGSRCFNPASNCDPGGLTTPIFEFGHNSGRCAVVGGYVYRGRMLASLRGTYFFADWCTGTIWSFRLINDVVTEFTDRTAQLAPSGSLEIDAVSSFGEDADGNLLICDHNDGEIYKVVPGGLTLDAAGPFIAGNATLFSISNGLPNSSISFFYTLEGLGSTFWQPLGITLDLEQAILVRQDLTNAQGAFSGSHVMPFVLSGQRIHIQAAQIGMKSNVFTDMVE